VAYTPSAIARTIPHKASITVIEGCNKRCTFCVVPTTRGKERRRRLADVVEESRRLIEEGVVEIELLGQTVNAFVDPETGQDFADLIRAVGTLDGLRRLRFVTSHPRNFADRLISAMAETKTICPSLHLPVQSGSDKVLYRMKRQYTRAEYVDLAGRIRRAIPDIALSTDIIVGFPGETDEDFEQTLEIVRELEFASAFCFVYSPRPHTAAVRWENDIPRPVSSERLTRLLDLQQEIQKKLHANLEGKVVEVLVDGDDRKGKKSSGRSRCNRVVNLDVPRRFRPGTFVDVEVSRGLPNSLLAFPVSA
jgi:tRNA-2-methylthio-N6-dimethylallyladenosine synthase